jgi:hypothetical protein
VTDEMLRGDEIYQAVKQIVFRMHADYNKPQPEHEYLIATAMSWRDHLKKAGVPSRDVELLYAETVGRKSRTEGAAFMPVIGDLLKQWDLWLLDGYWEKQNASEVIDAPALPPGQSPLPGGISTDGAPEFVKIFAEFTRRGGVVTCHCDGDRWCHGGKKHAALLSGQWGSFWQCAKGVCDFQVAADGIMQLLPAQVEVAPEPVPLPAEREYSDDELLDILGERTGFDASKVGGEKALLFARFLMKVTPPDLWTAFIAKSQWQKWNESHKAAA